MLDSSTANVYGFERSSTANGGHGLSPAPAPVATAASAYRQVSHPYSHHSPPYETEFLLRREVASLSAQLKESKQSQQETQRNYDTLFEESENLKEELSTISRQMLELQQQREEENKRHEVSRHAAQSHQMSPSRRGHPRDGDPLAWYRYVPPHTFLPEVFVQEYFEVLEIIDKFARLYYKHNTPRHILAHPSTVNDQGEELYHQDKKRVVESYLKELEQESLTSELTFTKQKLQQAEDGLQVQTTLVGKLQKELAVWQLRGPPVGDSQLEDHQGEEEPGGGGGGAAAFPFPQAVAPPSINPNAGSKMNSSAPRHHRHPYPVPVVPAVHPEPAESGSTPIPALTASPIAVHVPTHGHYEVSPGQKQYPGGEHHLSSQPPACPAVTAAAGGVTSRPAIPSSNPQKHPSGNGNAYGYMSQPQQPAPAPAAAMGEFVMSSPQQQVDEVPVPSAALPVSRTGLMQREGDELRPWQDLQQQQQPYTPGTTAPPPSAARAPQHAGQQYNNPAAGVPPGEDLRQQGKHTGPVESDDHVNVRGSEPQLTHPLAAMVQATVMPSVTTDISRSVRDVPMQRNTAPAPEHEYSMGHLEDYAREPPDYSGRMAIFPRAQEQQQQHYPRQRATRETPPVNNSRSRRTGSQPHHHIGSPHHPAHNQQQHLRPSRSHSRTGSGSRGHPGGYAAVEGFEAPDRSGMNEERAPYGGSDYVYEQPHRTGPPLFDTVPHGEEDADYISPARAKRYRDIATGRIPVSGALQTLNQQPQSHHHHAKMVGDSNSSAPNEQYEDASTQPLVPPGLAQRYVDEHRARTEGESGVLKDWRQLGVGFADDEHTSATDTGTDVPSQSGELSTATEGQRRAAAVASQMAAGTTGTQQRMSPTPVESARASSRSSPTPQVASVLAAGQGGEAPRGVYNGEMFSSTHSTNTPASANTPASTNTPASANTPTSANATVSRRSSQSSVAAEMKSSMENMMRSASHPTDYNSGTGASMQSSRTSSVDANKWRNVPAVHPLPDAAVPPVTADLPSSSSNAADVEAPSAARGSAAASDIVSKLSSAGVSHRTTPSSTPPQAQLTPSGAVSATEQPPL